VILDINWNDQEIEVNVKRLCANPYLSKP
jgi:hypothetical protein